MGSETLGNAATKGTVTVDDHRPHGSAAFPDTSWALVLATRDDASSGHGAFADLCRRYWRPIYATLRRRGFAAADGEDLVQGFSPHLIEHDTVARADPTQGRFRSFLLGALRWFLANDRERERARKRGGRSTFVPIDTVEVESSLQIDADAGASIDLQFDRQWARALVRNALDTLRAEYDQSGQAQMYAALQPCLDLTAAAPSYATLATRLARNECAIKVAVHRLRGRFRAALRREVGYTVATAAEIEDERAYLRHVLAATPVSASVPLTFHSVATSSAVEAAAACAIRRCPMVCAPAACSRSRSQRSPTRLTMMPSRAAATPTRQSCSIGALAAISCSPRSITAASASSIVHGRPTSSARSR